jgi:AcrR family transcriptional regulator
VADARPLIRVSADAGERRAVTWLPFDPALQPGIQGRRHELFRLAAPVFRAHGYRGSTIKALAHACHLSPAALYHYFPSKAAFATFLVDDDRLDWDSTRIDPDIDPLVQLRMSVDLVIEVLPTYLLAIDLAREIGRPLSQPELARFFGQGEAIFGRVLAAVAPGDQRPGVRRTCPRLDSKVRRGARIVVQKRRDTVDVNRGAGSWTRSTAVQTRHPSVE